MKESKKRVLVGMSGGIDSTATCLMLQEQGYEIVGVTMRVWGDEPQDARELAARMGIEHYVADERVPFKDTIVKNFIDEPGRDVQAVIELPDVDRRGWQAGERLDSHRALLPVGRAERTYLYRCR